MDNKASFGMHLTKQASLLMTFNMHILVGTIFHVSHLDLKISQDIFQMRMDDIVTQCPGILAIDDERIHLR